MSRYTDSPWTDLEASALLDLPERDAVAPVYPRYIYILYSSYTVRLWMSDIDTDEAGTRANWESITRQAILTKLPEAEVSYYYLPYLPNMEVRAVPQECLMPMKDGTMVLTDVAAMTASIISDLNLQWRDYVRRRPSGAGKE